MALNHVFIGDKAAKKIIIFLHEGLGSIAQWKAFPELVCNATNSYGLIYDRCGYGKSEGSLLNRKTDYLEQGALELEKVIASLVPSTYDLFLYGHSDGGSIAIIYAANHPSKLKGLITEAAHVFVEDITVEGVRAVLPYFHQGKFDGLKKYHGERFQEVFLAWNNIWLNPAFRSWNISQLLSNIICPQLIIQGEADQYGTLNQVETIVENTVGKSTTFTPRNCNHAPHKENEKETLLHIVRFLEPYN
ncbi:MAG: pimeloyl-ACP methyl ester carboxylesterase [Crocinitomix sp.]|jgi:pimeloyl-ACP methyl ester carboxylesterase